MTVAKSAIVVAGIIATPESIIITILMKTEIIETESSFGYGMDFCRGK